MKLKNNKYLNVRRIPKYNIKVIERGKIDILTHLSVGAVVAMIVW